MRRNIINPVSSENIVQMHVMNSDEVLVKNEFLVTLDKASLTAQKSLYCRISGAWSLA